MVTTISIIRLRSGSELGNQNVGPDHLSRIENGEAVGTLDELLSTCSALK